MARAGSVPTGVLVAVVVLALLATSQLAVALVNWLATMLRHAASAAAHGFLDGHSAEHRARWSWCRRCSPARAASTSWSRRSRSAILANRDDNLHFALLTDFRDAGTETHAGRRLRCCALAEESIDALNASTARSGTAAHERDASSCSIARAAGTPRERVWMGYERKRGKLGDLNALAARRERGERFSLDRRRHGGAAGGQVRHHARHRHAAAARRRAPAGRRDGASAQPAAVRRRARPRHRGLRHPAAARRRQPAQREPLAGSRGCSAATPASIRTRAPSPTSIRTVRRRLVHRQGHLRRRCLRAARCGDASPRTASSATICSKAATRARAWSATCSCSRTIRRATCADVSRRHRWIRGDWQIAGWLLPRVPGAGRARAAESVLRAVAVEDPRQPAPQPRAGRAAGLLLLGWTVLAGRRGAGRCSCSAIVAAAVADRVAARACLASRTTCRWRSTCARRRARRCGQHRRRSLFTLAFLPYEAFVSLDAIVRTLLAHAGHAAAAAGMEDRRATPSAARASDLAGIVARRCGSRPRSRCRRRGCAGRDAARLRCRSRCRCSRCGSSRRSIAWWLSRPLARRAPQLTRGADASSCASSRAGPGVSSRPSSDREDNWLPPDNFQEHPGAVVAHRTSPDQHRLALLANLAAYDFGYLSAGQLLERTGATLATRWTRWSGIAGTSTTGTTRDAPAAAAALRLDGRQRQPRRPPADACARAAGAGRRADRLQPRIFDGLARHAAACCVEAHAARTAARGRQLRASIDGACEAQLARPAHRRSSLRSHRGVAIGCRPTRRRSLRRAALQRRCDERAAWARRARRAVPTSTATSCRARALAAHCRRALAADRATRCRRSQRPDAARARDAATDAASIASRVDCRRRRRDAATGIDELAQLARARRAARRRASRTIERLAAQCDELARRWTSRFLYDRRAPSVLDRLQRRRASPRRELLRSARLGGAARAASSPSRRGRCRRSTGSRSAAC